MQTYKNLEIIIVNDGSTDGTAQILSEYKAKDDRIRVFEQEHSGTANARNYGMTAASGEYISFVDADDWILLSLYEIFVKLNPPQGVDIYNFNAESYVENSKEIFSKKCSILMCGKITQLKTQYTLFITALTLLRAI